MKIDGQQNTTLFLMPTSQANFVNPAIANECKLTIGLPILSSMHFNYGNSAFSFRDLFSPIDGGYEINKTRGFTGVGNNNYLNTELYINWLHIGLWYKKTFFTFTVNEKIDMFGKMSGDFYSFLADGNTQFVGENVNIKIPTLAINYRREYAFGIVRKPTAFFSWGVRAKLLFGKLNVSAPQSDLKLLTSNTSFNWQTQSDIRFNTTLPITVASSSDGSYESMDDKLDPVPFLLNRKNWGFATDLGFVNKYDDDWTFSGSILDLGFIRWSSNPISLYNQSNKTITGPLNSSVPTINSLNDWTNSLQNAFIFKVESKIYYTALIPQIYLGATYSFKPDLNAGLVSYNRVARGRMTSGLTLSGNKSFSKWLALSVSYSYMYRAFNNFGAGFRIGNAPIQFYMVSDNLWGFYKPYDTRNLNLRFGLQFVFGCEKKKSISSCGCHWLREAEKKQTKPKRPNR